MEKLLLNNKYFIKQDFQIEINEISRIPPHTHDFIEFVYMLKGRSNHVVDGVEYPMNSGDLLIINYDQQHSFDGDPKARFCNILIKPAFVDKNLRECTDLFNLFETEHYGEFKELIDNKRRHIRFSPEEKRCFEYMVLLLDKELKDGVIGCDITTRAGVGFLLTMIFRKMCRSLTGEPGDFKYILAYIGENYKQNISAAYLAEMCHYNTSYFSRVFKKYTGTTFSEYLKRVRITKACELIAEKSVMINDVCEKIGYTNKTNFYKHFRQVVGMTPGEFKRAQRKTAEPV